MQIENVAAFLGLAAFAVSGALAGIRQRFDVVGVVALSLVTATGGGVIRDVSLGALPPAVLTEPGYLVVPIVAGLVTMPFHHWIEGRFRRPVLVFDAVGLGLFCVDGANRALAHGIGPLGAIGLGVIAATGGGILRDLMSGERPLMFRADSVLYSIPAAAGAGAIVVADRVGADLSIVGPFVALGVCIVRLLAVRYGWRAPRLYGERADEHTSSRVGDGAG